VIKECSPEVEDFLSFGWQLAKLCVFSFQNQGQNALVTKYFFLTRPRVIYAVHMYFRMIN
jgi:hypothetical protein